MTGTGSAMVNTPAMAHKDPTIFPHTPTGLRMGNELVEEVVPRKLYIGLLNLYMATNINTDIDIGGFLFDGNQVVFEISC